MILEFRPTILVVPLNCSSIAGDLQDRYFLVTQASEGVFEYVRDHPAPYQFRPLKYLHLRDVDLLQKIYKSYHFSCVTLQ
jgi:hypothetical protein